MANNHPFNIKATRQEPILGEPYCTEVETIMVNYGPAWNVDRIRISSGYFTLRVERRAGENTYDTVTADLNVDVPSDEMFSAVVSGIPSFFSKYETPQKNQQNLDRLKGEIAALETRMAEWEVKAGA